MKRLFICLMGFLILCSFKGAMVYNPVHDGDYVFKDAAGKGHAWQVHANPKYMNKVDFLRPHHAETVFSAEMTDATHFKTKSVFALQEADGEYTREYNTYGEFVDSATMFLHLRIRRTHMMGRKMMIQDTALEYTYLKIAKSDATGYPMDVDNGD